MAVKGKGKPQGQAGASALGMIPPQVYWCTRYNWGCLFWYC